MLDFIWEGEDGGGFCGDGGGLFGVGKHKLLQNSLIAGDGVSHIIHVVIHFVNDVGGDAVGWPG